MFDVYFCSRVAQRLQSNRDAVVLAGFLGYLDRRGHSRNTVQQYVRAAELFLRWLRRHQQQIASINETTVCQFACRFSAESSRHTTHAALRHLVRHLRAEGRTAARAPAAKPAVERFIGEYKSYLGSVCGLAAATQSYRGRYAREFVQFVFGSGSTDWRRLRPGQIHDFIAQYGANGRTAAAQVAAVSLRSFLRWLQFQGRLNFRLVAAVPCFRKWQLAALPTVMSDEQLRLFLASFDRSRSSGRRDYAMALCMADLGLRVAEVAELRINDVDVAAGTLRLSPGKARRDRQLPMTRRIRRAVIAYLRRGRPQTDVPALFVRHRVPIGAAVTRELIRGVMRRAYAVVPGCESWTGTHVLRHTAATRLQCAGADLKRIADILGHRSLDTTAIYTKVDLTRLAEVALPWPGGEEGHS